MSDNDDILDALKNSKDALTNKSKLKPCSQCKGTKYVLTKMINNGCGECYPYVCDFCGSRSPIVEKKEVAIEMGFVCYE